MFRNQYFKGGFVSIVIHLDRVMDERGVSVSELARVVGITRANMSNLKAGKIKAIRFSTLEGICHYLKCQPGDIIEFIDD